MSNRETTERLLIRFKWKMKYLGVTWKELKTMLKEVRKGARNIEATRRKQRVLGIEELILI